MLGMVRAAWVATPYVTRLGILNSVRHILMEALSAIPSATLRGTMAQQLGWDVKIRKLLMISKWTSGRVSWPNIFWCHSYWVSLHFVKISLSMRSSSLFTSSGYGESVEQISTMGSLKTGKICSVSDGWMSL